MLHPFILCRKLEHRSILISFVFSLYYIYSYIIFVLWALIDIGPLWMPTYSLRFWILPSGALLIRNLAIQLLYNKSKPQTFHLVDSITLKNEFNSNKSILKDSNLQVLWLELFDLEFCELVQKQFLDLLHPERLLLHSGSLNDVHLLSTLQPHLKWPAIAFNCLSQSYLRHLQHPNISDLVVQRNPLVEQSSIKSYI